MKTRRAGSPSWPGPETPAPAEPAFPSNGCDGFLTPRDRQNERRVRRWAAAAGLLYVAATAALRWPSQVPAALPSLLCVATAAVAVWAVVVQIASLRQADELRRRIESEALGLGFGVGVLAALLSPLLPALGLPEPGGAEIAVAMLLAAAVGSWLGVRRYGRGA